jgi:hypothetical protein
LLAARALSSAWGDHTAHGGHRGGVAAPHVHRSQTI